MSDGVLILCSFLLGNDVDFETLTLLTESQISTLVPSIGKQARILNAIKKVIFSLNKKKSNKINKTFKLKFLFKKLYCKC